MQNPPPGPPPGGQPPSYQPPGGQQPGYPPPSYQPAAGIDKKLAVFLSYLAGWVTGLIFLFVAKDDPDVKFHAARSVVFFGGSSVIFWALRIFESFLPGIISWPLVIVGVVLAIYTFVVWVICLVQSLTQNGARFPIPISQVDNIVTQYAEQLAAAVN